MSLSVEYKSFSEQWDKKASIRSISRRMLEESKLDLDYYPRKRQPLCNHDLVKKQGADIEKFILVQSAYKFMHEIAVVEVDIVNQIATKIFSGAINYSFSDSMRKDMLAVIIDEAYHAYVANDFIQQVSECTGITPLKESRITQFENAIADFKEKVSERLHPAVDVIAICVGESTLTKELFDMSKEKTVNPLFRNIIIDHVADEGRHQILFRELLKTFWLNLPESDKEQVGSLIPNFLIDYTCPDMHIEFDRLMLFNCNLTKEEVDIIINDIYQEGGRKSIEKRIDPITKNIMKSMNYAQILQHPQTYNQFSLNGFV